jgi:hypothetical protein
MVCKADIAGETVRGQRSSSISVSSVNEMNPETPCLDLRSYIFRRVNFRMESSVGVWAVVANRGRARNNGPEIVRPGRRDGEPRAKGVARVQIPGIISTCVTFEMALL